MQIGENLQYNIEETFIEWARQVPYPPDSTEKYYESLDIFIQKGELFRFSPKIMSLFHQSLDSKFNEDIMCFKCKTEIIYSEITKTLIKLKFQVFLHQLGFQIGPDNSIQSIVESEYHKHDKALALCKNHLEYEDLPLFLGLFSIVFVYHSSFPSSPVYYIDYFTRFGDIFFHEKYLYFSIFTIFNQNTSLELLSDFIFKKSFIDYNNTALTSEVLLSLQICKALCRIMKNFFENPDENKLTISFQSDNVKFLKFGLSCDDEESYDMAIKMFKYCTSKSIQIPYDLKQLFLCQIHKTSNNDWQFQRYKYYRSHIKQIPKFFSNSLWKKNILICNLNLTESQDIINIFKIYEDWNQVLIQILFPLHISNYDPISKNLLIFDGITIDFFMEQEDLIKQVTSQNNTSIESHGFSFISNPYDKIVFTSNVNIDIFFENEEIKDFLLNRFYIINIDINDRSEEIQDTQSCFYYHISYDYITKHINLWMSNYSIDDEKKYENEENEIDPHCYD